MEELSLENILDQNEIDNLFGPEEETPDTENQEKEKENKTTEDIDTDSLFEDPESVGSEEDNQEKGDTSSDEAEVSSPKNNFFSSIAKALKEDGILPDLDDTKVNDPEGLAEAMRDRVQSMFDEAQQRVLRALDAGLEDSEVREYERVIGYLDSITEDSIKDESENGEKLRKNLIYQDFINRGYSKERAQREVKKSFDGGTDIEDALEALTSNTDFYKDRYNSIIEEAEEERKQAIAERKKEAEKLKKDILDNDTVFGDIKVDKAIRQKAFDSISKPIFKDPNTGEVLTAIQKYEKENRSDFLKNIGLLFALTDGFKNIDSLVQSKVKKEVKKGLRNLEHTINTTSRNSDGSLRFSSGVSDNASSFSTFDFDV